MIKHFLLPEVLEAVAAYWNRDLAEQVASGDPPPWRQVIGEIEPLLVAFLEQDSKGSDT